MRNSAVKDKIDTGSNGDLTCASHSAISRLSDSLAPTRRRHERWPDEEREVVNEKVYGSNRTNKSSSPGGRLFTSRLSSPQAPQS